MTGADEEPKGSDGRLNVSSRSDSRGYYNSRDKGLCFSVVFNMTLCADDEFFAYWRNASPDKTLVISAIGVNAGEACNIKLHFVTGTAASGTELTPVNLNKASSKSAPDDSVVMAMEGNTTTPISGLTTAGTIDYLGITAANGHEEFRLGDRVRLGQNDAIALEGEDIATTTPIWGVMFGYYE